MSAGAIFGRPYFAKFHTTKHLNAKSSIPSITKNLNLVHFYCSAECSGYVPEF